MIYNGIVIICYRILGFVFMLNILFYCFYIMIMIFLIVKLGVLICGLVWKTLFLYIELYLSLKNFQFRVIILGYKVIRLYFQGIIKLVLIFFFRRLIKLGQRQEYKLYEISREFIGGFLLVQIFFWRGKFRDSRVLC